MPAFSFLRTSSGADQRYDVMIAACGYESRSSFVARSILISVDRLVAFPYPENRVLSFDWNFEFFSEVAEIREAPNSDEFERSVADLVRTAESTSSELKLAVDVSSFDRERLSRIVLSIQSAAADRPIEVTFLYAAAEFRAEDNAASGTVLVNGPLKGFEGWTADPSRPVACIIGLGFENLIALAALETLEPARTVAFIAKSSDIRFHERVVSDNTTLLTSKEVALLPYNIDDAFGAIHDLEEVVFALRGQFRVALVPLGPKLFALMSILVALEYRDEIAVWRVSSDQSETLVDHAATGQITTLSARLRNSD